MAQSLIRALASLALAIGLPGGVAYAAGDTLIDPTQPPPSLGQVAGAAATDANPVLQSILISPTRRSAIINGQAVQLNAPFMQWRLVKIAESEVTLRNGDQVQILKLFPDIKMRPSKSSAAMNNNEWK